MKCMENNNDRIAQPRMCLNVFIPNLFHQIQPHSGLWGALCLRFQRFHLWLFKLNPSGSSIEIKIAKRLNVNSHVVKPMENYVDIGCATP